MAKIRVAINGFGRIGRLTMRQLLKNPDIDVVAINDLSDVKTLAHLFKYDSSQGTFDGKIETLDGIIKINEDSFKVFSERNPADLPWGQMNVDVVLESTGVFGTLEKASLHLEAGAKRVVLSAPPKGDGINMYVFGVNEDKISRDELVVSNASCTTNCLAPMCKVLDEKFGIVNGLLTTVHAYTSTQSLQDAPHKDLRRARAAAASIIPTTTGAALAVEKVLPKLKDKLNGLSMRVPVITGSISDFSVVLEKKVTREEINQAFLEASKSEYKGIIKYLEDELVSADIIGSTYSCLFDPFLTYVQGNLIKVNGWYDNEYGYSSRSAQLVEKVGKML